MGAPSPSASASPVTPPSTFARRYTFLRRLAVGGMGELLLARAAGAGGVHKLVAIKRVRPEYRSDPTFVSMFLNEARLAATLDHPNVVRTYDLVEDGGSFFMVMEYLHGESLGRVLNAVASASGPTPLQHVVTIVLGVAAGLHCAHERRGDDGRPLDIVHRDLSPGNVFLTHEGGVKLLDFGIAKATSRTSITVGPTRKGKVAYMSPEQCVGEDVDRRSDIFALGVVMWELCTGRRLFRGDNEFSIMNQVTTIDAPSPRQHVPDLPEALCEIIAKALRRDRDERWQTAMDLHDAVEAFARAHGILPSGPALGRFVEEHCGHREYPSLEPSDEFVGGHQATLVVPDRAPSPQRQPRRWSVVLALAAGAFGGAVAVAASSGTPEPATRTDRQTPTDTAPRSAEPIADAPPEPEPGPSELKVGQSGVAPSPAPDPSPNVDAPPVEAAPKPDHPEPPTRRRARSGRKPKSSHRPPEPVDADADKTVRGVDGLLPRG
jgi:serine/threonine protein kinase